MHNKETVWEPEQNDIAAMHGSIPRRMLITCVLACVSGMALMALTGHYLLMGVFASILACMSVTTPLFRTGKISIETACLAPMLMLCFVYTPVSWFTFDGLMGCTPYLSILFATMITLTYYKRKQALLLSLYSALLLLLILHWLAARPDGWAAYQVADVLAAYSITAVIILSVVEGVKRKNLEINKQITELSLRDDLTGLFNRRAVGQLMDRLEKRFAQNGAGYAVLMMDVDRFKDINDLYGHHLGDSVLKGIAACLGGCLGDSDYAFRFGGDELLLVLPGADSAYMHTVRRRVEAALYQVQGYVFLITVSMGCALRSEAASDKAVLELADRRMYEDKKGKEWLGA